MTQGLGGGHRSLCRDRALPSSDPLKHFPPWEQVHFCPILTARTGQSDGLNMIWGVLVFAMKIACCIFKSKFVILCSAWVAQPSSPTQAGAAQGGRNPLPSLDFLRAQP